MIKAMLEEGQLNVIMEDGECCNLEEIEYLKFLEEPGVELGLQAYYCYESEIKSWTCWFPGLTNE